MLKPGTKVTHIAYGQGVVLDRHSQEVQTYVNTRQRVQGDWTYVRLLDGTINGFVESALKTDAQILDDRIKQLELDLEYVKKQRADLNKPKPGEIWKSPSSAFTATVKYVDDTYVYYTWTAENSPTPQPAGKRISNFLSFYRPT